MDRETLEKHLRMDTPRTRRAYRFAASIIKSMMDFVPRDRECLRRIEDHLVAIGYEHNAEIISVPPECDALDKLQLERHKLETHPLYISADETLDRK